MSAARRPDESFADYKMRRTMENARDGAHLEGRMVFISRSKPFTRDGKEYVRTMTYMKAK